MKPKCPLSNKSVVISNPIYLMHQLGVFHYACNYTTPVITAGPPDVSVWGLLELPQGHVTMHSINFNLRVVMEYIDCWILQKGVDIINHCVEDSATAEISHSQVSAEACSIAMAVLAVALDQIRATHSRDKLGGFDEVLP